MQTEQLRKALGELNGQRNAVFYFTNAEPCLVPNAMLLPDEGDNLIKVTDGKYVYILDAEHVDWIRIG